MAAFGRAVLDLVVDRKGLEQGLKAAERTSTQRISAIGKRLSVSVTPAILGIGAAVLAATNTIDKAFGTIRTGTGGHGQGTGGAGEGLPGRLHHSSRRRSDDRNRHRRSEYHPGVDRGAATGCCAGGIGTGPGHRDRYGGPDQWHRPRHAGVWRGVGGRGADHGPPVCCVPADRHSN